ncbi:thaumatin-like protein 1b isoform X2 [Durio zibethinus]|uniref:Thaumatin-like protein 1b isoform X2 n=1 Tax=Durio zibethinus TaxID=66656 RepID=A0A6P6ADZ1_DURZI|nr:thaumatin-like protein 1b isoform X2 [Durio zibethinus]
MMDRLHLSSTIVSLLFISLFSEVNPASFKIVNKCRHTIWPGFLSGAKTAQLPTTGFVLNPGKSRTVTIPTSWSGRLWGRNLCGQDSSGKFACLSGDCGTGQIECSGSGAKPPATLAEFTLNGDRGLDFYDISLVDGFNLPMLVVAKGGKGGNCSATGCLLDLNGACPSQLRVMRPGGAGVGCRSACEAFGDPEYCCTGAFGTPDVCRPSAYSLFFKRACPRAYSYAYDDVTSIYTCAGADYVIIFCPPPYSRSNQVQFYTILDQVSSSQKVFGARKDGALLPLVSKSMIYLSSVHANGASLSGK